MSSPIIAATLVAITLSAAYAVSPGQRPLSAGGVAPSAQTVEAIRQRLQGTWTLQSLTVSSFEGKPLSIDASGMMRLDGFGNLHVEFQFSDDGLARLARDGIALPTPKISTDGQATIDAQTSQIVYVDAASSTRLLDASLADMRRNPFALQHRRHYQFNDDGTLTLSTRYDTGKDAAVGRWKKKT